jgi:hypothetical protein
MAGPKSADENRLWEMLPIHPIPIRRLLYSQISDTHTHVERDTFARLRWGGQEQRTTAYGEHNAMPKPYGTDELEL